MNQHRSRRSRVLNLVPVAVLAALGVAYVIVPNLLQWKAAEQASHFARQEDTPEQPLDPEALGRLSNLSATSYASPPLILTYHDISNSPSYYAVSPEQFDVQMHTLVAAGFHAITAQQLEAWWSKGAALPDKPVLLTFDDGARGVWKYADRILERYGLHGVSFVVTGFVGTRAPYYMTWPEIESLQLSGRWDIESHTHLGHVKVPVSAAGEEAPFLNNLQYLTQEGRIETIEEYQGRVRSDLEASISEIESHGLPRPRLFAYPYSAHTSSPDVTRVLDQTVNSLFDLSMLDENGSAATAPSDLREHRLRRSDIVQDVSMTDFVSRIENSSDMTENQPDPLSQTSMWVDAAGNSAGFARTADGYSFDPGIRGWAGRIFMPNNSLFWRNYRVTETVTLPAHPASKALSGLRVLVGSPDQIQITISSATAQVRAVGQPGEVLFEHRLHGSRHSVVVDVMRSAVRVTVDGAVMGLVPISEPGTGASLSGGGIELTCQRELATDPIPVLNELAISSQPG